ncbi:MAG: SGNH/GDSL hydrolase family protein [Alphaproteobacteria bacterium]
MRHYRSAIKIVTVNLLVLLLGVAAVELVFGAWFGATYDPRLRLLCNVEYRFDVSALYAAREPALYRRDAWCLRGATADPAEVALLTLGGSTTDQRYLGEGDTWQDRLAAHMQAGGHPLAVANAGMDGQSSVGHIVALDGWLRRIPRLQPPYVLLYVGLNDVVLGWRADYDGETPAGFWPRAAQYLKTRSAVLGLARLVVGMAEARLGRLGHAQFAIDEAHARWVPLVDVAPVRAVLAERLAAYAGRLETLERNIRAWGAKAIFVTQPRADRRLGPAGEMLGLIGADGRMDGDTPALGLFNETSLAVCRREGAICIDLAGELALGDGDYYDLEHYTPAGAEKIGAYLARKLATVMAPAAALARP